MSDGARYNRFETVKHAVRIDGLEAMWFEYQPGQQSILDAIGSRIVVLDFKQTGFEHDDFEAFCASYLNARGYQVSGPPKAAQTYESPMLSLNDKELSHA
jgi:hypothetical protein